MENSHFYPKNNDRKKYMRIHPTVGTTGGHASDNYKGAKNSP
jgi:hypothetical protein